MNRLRVTRRLPIVGTHNGLVVWFGSIERGWVGKHINPFRWHLTYRISSGPKEESE